jgi:hypothetical protein
MGRRAAARWWCRAAELSGPALEAAAEWRAAGVAYRQIARLLRKRRLVEQQPDGATVRRALGRMPPRRAGGGV